MSTRAFLAFWAFALIYLEGFARYEQHLSCCRPHAFGVDVHEGLRIKN